MASKKAAPTSQEEYPSPHPLGFKDLSAAEKAAWARSLKAGTGEMVDQRGRLVWVPTKSISSGKKLSLAEWRALDQEEQMQRAGQLDPSAHLPGGLTSQEKARIQAHTKAKRVEAARKAAATKRGW